jgi:hypothetical protein
MKLISCTKVYSALIDCHKIILLRFEPGCYILDLFKEDGVIIRRRHRDGHRVGHRFVMLNNRVDRTFTD